MEILTLNSRIFAVGTSFLLLVYRQLGTLAHFLHKSNCNIVNKSASYDIYRFSGFNFIRKWIAKNVIHHHHFQPVFYEVWCLLGVGCTEQISKGHLEDSYVRLRFYILSSTSWNKKYIIELKSVKYLRKQLITLAVKDKEAMLNQLNNEFNTKKEELATNSKPTLYINWIELDRCRPQFSHRICRSR